MNNKETQPNTDVIISQIGSEIDRFRPELSDFYDQLIQLQNLHLNNLIFIESGFRSFIPTIGHGLDNNHVYIRETSIDQVLDRKSQHVISMVGTSSSGKSTVKDRILRCSDLYTPYRTFTTRPPQENRAEEWFTEEILLSELPKIIGLASSQYIHVSESDLILLAQGHYREFIERKERGEFTYASSEQLIEMSLSEADFALGVVDFDGARKIKSFYQKNHPDVQVLTTYLMPSNMSFVQLTKRIINSRPMGEILGNANPGRGVLAVEEIYRAQSEEVDLIIHNPNEEKGPFTAVDAYCDLANWLKKE